MQPKIILSVAWANRAGMSDADIDSLIDLMASSAIPAVSGDLCPRCRNHPVDSEIQFFAPESATATAEQVRSRAIVKCLCGITYWYAAVHEVDVQQFIGQASIRAASTSRTPGTGALQIDGQPVPPLVVEEIAVTGEVAVVVGPAAGTVEQQSLIPTPPPEPPVSRIITTWYRLPWYGRYAREASKAFAGLLTGALLVLNALGLLERAASQYDAMSPDEIRSLLTPRTWEEIEAKARWELRVSATEINSLPRLKP